jgi:hypothetical protein
MLLQAVAIKTIAMIGQILCLDIDKLFSLYFSGPLASFYTRQVLEQQ